jgi:CheY-like chemotaxis protein
VQSKGTIVVVEEDDLIRALLERWLGEAGYAVVAANCENPTRGDPPCLVIANLPRPIGAEALVSSLQAAHRAPILALSARFRRGLGTSLETARRLGVRNVLPIPFTRKELLQAVSDSIGSAA